MMSLNKDKILQETIAKMDATIAKMDTQFPKTIEGKQREAMIEAINQVIDEFATLTEKRSAKSPKSLRSSLSHLPQKRIDLIRHSFDIQTFHPSVDKERKTCNFFKDGLSVMPPISIDAVDGLMKANNYIIASMVVECVVFCLNCVGFSPPHEALLRAVDKVWQNDKSLFKDLEPLFDEMKKAYFDDDRFKLATLVIQVIRIVYGGPLYNDIVGALLSSMSWFDWFIFYAKIIAFVLLLILDVAAEFLHVLELIMDAAGFLLKFKDL